MVKDWIRSGGQNEAETGSVPIDKKLALQVVCIGNLLDVVVWGERMMLEKGRKAGTSRSDQSPLAYYSWNSRGSAGFPSFSQSRGPGLKRPKRLTKKIQQV
jgi:hypothetical protein